MSETNKFMFTYHGHQSTKHLPYRDAKLGARQTRTIRATQTEQGVKGKSWIGVYERTNVSHGAGSHRTGHVAVEHTSKKAALGGKTPVVNKRTSSASKSKLSPVANNTEHVSGPKKV